MEEEWWFRFFQWWILRNKNIFRIATEPRVLGGFWRCAWTAWQAKPQASCAVQCLGPRCPTCWLRSRRLVLPGWSAPLIRNLAWGSSRWRPLVTGLCCLHAPTRLCHLLYPYEHIHLSACTPTHTHRAYLKILGHPGASIPTPSRGSVPRALWKNQNTCLVTTRSLVKIAHWQQHDCVARASEGVRNALGTSRTTSACFIAFRADATLMCSKVSLFDRAPTWNATAQFPRKKGTSWRKKKNKQHNQKRLGMNPSKKTSKNQLSLEKNRKKRKMAKNFWSDASWWCYEGTSRTEGMKNSKWTRIYQKEGGGTFVAKFWARDLNPNEWAEPSPFCGCRQCRPAEWLDLQGQQWAKNSIWKPRGQQRKRERKINWTPGWAFVSQMNLEINPPLVKGISSLQFPTTKYYHDGRKLPLAHSALKHINKNLYFIHGVWIRSKKGQANTWEKRP